MTNAFDSLLAKAKEIRDAVYEGENTAERVGGLFVELLTAASKALYGADGADTLLRKLSAKGFLTPGGSLAVEHKGTSASITIPSVAPDGTPGTESAVIGAVGNKAGLMLPAHVESINQTAQQIIDLAGKMAALVERLAELPVVDFDTVSLTMLPTTPWPGEISTLGCTFRVIYGEEFGQFLLEVSTIRASEAARYTSWDEIRASDGKVLVRPSTDYNDYDGESGTYAPLSGRLFHRAGTASLPAAFYAWDGESLREVNSFAGTLASLGGSIEALSSALGLHTSRLDRHEERLGDLVYKTDKLRTDSDMLMDNLGSAARMALDALNQSEDNAAAIEELEAAKRAVFNDIFNQACVTYPKEGAYWRTIIGGYDPENAPDAEHPYRLREVWMTYAEAVAVLAAGRPAQNSRSQYTNNSDIRTNLPAHGMNGPEAVFYPFYYCVNMEVANADNMSFRGTIHGCEKLHTINNLDDVTVDGIEICATQSLVNLTIKRLTKSINLGRNPLISRESLEQITANAANTSQIVIMLHADTFAKVCGDTTNEAAAELTPEELARWTALPTAAAAKNITFAEA